VKAEGFTKSYPDAAARAAAQAHHRWLSIAATPPLCLPRIIARGPRQLTFERVAGRHAQPEDLATLAALLGNAHGTTWTSALRNARLDQPYPLGGSLSISDFLSPRLAVLERQGHIPAAAGTRVLRDAAEGPAAFYKDTNPRNVLITRSGPVVVDFDDLTLAPFGYDLAKLIVTLAMTSGPLPPGRIGQALSAYNTAAAAHAAHLGTTTVRQLLAFSELHHAFTARYLGRGGYRHLWPDLRPSSHAIWPGGGAG
jgi:Ser/Thr protein kinase RdoA (MazF antagonist)